VGKFHVNIKTKFQLESQFAFNSPNVLLRLEATGMGEGRMTVFESECKQRIGQLRSVFIELYDSVRADPSSPQEFSRKFRVNKTLAWNMARLLQASDPLAAVSHVPGASSLEKVIQATVRQGADPQVVARARQAVQGFRLMIEAHAGDRPTLDLMIDATGRGDDGRLELSRKLAFRGNSGLYGVQARTRVKCNLLAPSPQDPSRLDMVDIGGYVGFRRLRPSVRWPIRVVRSWSDRDDPLVGPAWEPIEPDSTDPDGSNIMRSFSRGPVPDISLVESPDGRDYVLGAGPVGNEGAFDCFHGEMMRSAVYRYRQNEGDIGEFGAAITAPAEHLVFDIIVHEELDFALKPEVLVFGRIFPQGHTGSNDDSSLLPIKQSAVELLGQPPVINTPLIRRYPELLQSVYRRMGWSAEQFRGTRLVMKYPPLGAHVILRFQLPAPA
jgi:hypothetical protein